MANNPPPTPNRLPVWFQLLMAAGPLVGGLGFASKLIPDPWQALGLAVVYELLVLVFGFVTKVWDQLETDWSKRIAGRVNASVSSAVSGYHRQYLQHIVFQHRNFDVKGLTIQGPYNLELERVYVELQLDPRPVHGAAVDPLHSVPEALRTGQHTIWEFLRATPAACPNFALLGPPGSGKTTLLKHMALALASPHALPPSLPPRLPILLFLREHVADITAHPDYTLTQAVQDRLKKFGVQPGPEGWFQDQLNRGRCLVLLDGLDEVADSAARQSVVQWVERQMAAYGQNPFLITSRPFGYRANPIAGVTVLEVQPFTAEQVRRFVDNWYLANELMASQKDDEGVRLDARRGAEDLLQRLRSTPALSALAVNPLLLTMIATVHRYRSSLPGRRVELYAEICEVFLGKRQQARGQAVDLTPTQKQRVLQPLAYQMMRCQQREILQADAVAAIRDALQGVSPNLDGAAFLKSIEDSSGLLLERENGLYTFAHLTFQEYLAAAYLKDNHLGANLLACVSDPWWHETIRLYAAQTDATDIILACLSSDRPALPALVLAVECRDEAASLQPQAHARLQQILDQGVEDSDPDRRHLAAEALLTLRLRRLRPLDDHGFVDPTLITHAEYQLFLDERYVQGQYHQPDHWTGDHFPSGEGQSPVVGVRPSDAVAFCDWLTRRESGDRQYRLLRQDELVSAGDQAIPAGCGYWVAGPSGFVCAGSRPALPAATRADLPQRLKAHFV